MGLGITNFEHEAIVESWTTIKSIKNTLELLERNDIRTMNSNIWDLKYSINHIKGQTSGNDGRVDVIDNKIDAVNENLNTVNENIGKIADFVNNYFNNKDNSQNAKKRFLADNGIFAMETNKDHFIQHNDYFEHKTFFQCPKCKSLNVDDERAYGSNEPVVIVKSCRDCGYKHTTNLTKEDE